MKKLIAITLCLLIFIYMISPTAVFAQEDPVGEQIADVGAAATITGADSYILTDSGEIVLEVAHVKAPGMTAALDPAAMNGYYTAEFILPETNYRVFLTGLTQDNAEEIRQEIIDSYVEGENFSIADLGFIDTEKTWADDGDENLCWAASTSNILTYTGWAAQAGFTDPDDLFETFIDAFDDNAGNIEYATGWFINGIAAPGGAQSAAGTGGYLPQYNYSDLVQTFDVYTDCSEQLATVYERLHSGYGVSLSLDIYGGSGYEGAHSVTCWGFVTDIRFPETARDFYRSVLITDSDSDKFRVKGSIGRRDADNVMSLCHLEQVRQEGIDTYMFDISDRQIGLIAEAVTVVPYSADVPYETAADATMDPLTTPDISIEPFVLTDDADNDEETKTVFEPNETIYYHPYMMNVSNVTYSGPLYLTVTVKDAQGNTLYARDFTYSQITDIRPSSGVAFDKQSISPKLDVGDYTITASFNPDHNRTEAYYFNNVKTVRFKVRESYIVGDADGSGTVDSIDATVMQRVLAMLSVDADGNIHRRGDITQNDTLDLLDVTFLQRYLANIAIAYPVDITRFYD